MSPGKKNTTSSVSGFAWIANRASMLVFIQDVVRERDSVS